MENNGQFNRENNDGQNPLLWKILFFGTLTGYCLYYAPFGINETDGGFLTGLGWQILNGKVLYGDAIYVRPPLPVWLRALELYFLPEQWAVLGERWMFYLKAGAYNWLGAAVLTHGARRWMLAVFGFVVSVHCYPPMAWHTIDGILCSVLAIYCIHQLRYDELTPGRPWLKIALSGVFVFASLLCKQSFYPMVAVFLGLLFFTPHCPGITGLRKVAAGAATLLCCTALFFSYLYANDLLNNYLRMTGGAASGGQALQHGVLDYFRIKPALAAVSVVVLAPAVWMLWKKKAPKPAAGLWVLWLMLLTGSYLYEIWNRQAFTVPFAQTRLLFWAGFVFTVWGSQLSKSVASTQFAQSDTGRSDKRFSLPDPYLLALFAVSWCASVSWGYNLPVLFAVPWVFAALEISRHLWQRAYPRIRLYRINLVALLALLAVFRCGYEFVYRDGQRRAMKTHLGEVFPALQGIYSTAEKGQLYLDLKKLAAQYPCFKTLPAIPQANFLTRTYPPLPLDWVVNRETNGDNALILKAIEKNKPVLLVEKTWAEKCETDPELTLTLGVLRKGIILGESPHFWVVQPDLEYIINNN